MCYGKKNVRYNLNNSNLGVARGRNIGFRIAQGEFIICLDDDAYLQPAELSKVKEYFQKNPMLGALSFSVVHAVTGEKQNPHGEKPVEVANYHGAAHALRASAIREIGFLDEECTFGGEEFDSCVRLHDKGYSCVYVPDIVAQHNSFLRKGEIGLSRSSLWHYNYVFGGWGLDPNFYIGGHSSWANTLGAQGLLGLILWLGFLVPSLRRGNQALSVDQGASGGTLSWVLFALGGILNPTFHSIIGLILIWLFDDCKVWQLPGGAAGKG
ncbi:MAG: glycosyltransferase [Candidatus Bilamarchaeaceae archaeon]